jgi:hypothetical protein
MTDNIGYTPGSGAKVAAREVSYSGETAFTQSVGLVTVAGPDDAKTATDVSPEAPLPVVVLGELVEAVEALRMTIGSLARSIGMALPNAQGFPIMEVRQATAANLGVTASIASGQTLATLTSVGTVSTVTNQSQIGAFAANDHIPALMHMQADGLRANIMVT